MATATRVPPKPVPDTRDVELTLTHGEAVTLMRLIGWHVVGDRSGPHGDLARIYTALRGIGVPLGDKLKTTASDGALLIKKD